MGTVRQAITYQKDKIVDQKDKILSSLGSISIFPKKKKKKLQVDFDYTVSIAKPQDVDHVVRFLKKTFFQREPLVKSLGLALNFDPILEKIIEEDLKLGCTLLAFSPGKERKIVGVCVNEKCIPWESTELEKLACQTENTKVQYLLHMWALMARESKLLETLKQNEIFGLEFLSVSKAYSGRGVATELARKSLALAKDLNYHYARMICTGEPSSIIAEKIGMTRIWKIPYKNILFEDSGRPVTIVPPPHNSVSVYYIDLKRLPDDFVTTNLKNK